MRLWSAFSQATLLGLYFINSLAAQDVYVTATERENQKLVRVDLTPPFTPASCTARTGSPDCITTLFNTASVPDSLVQDSQGRWIYSLPVANEVHRFDPIANTDILLANSTNGMNFPQDMIIDPTGNSYVLVSDEGGGKITKIDLTAPFPNGTTFATIPAPEGLVFDSMGNLYVNAGFQTAAAGIYQLDPTTGAVLNQRTGFDPANQLDGLAFDPSNPGFLFATSSGVIGPPPVGGSSVVYKIDLNNNLNPTPIAMVPTPDGIISNFHGLLYIASRTGYIYSVDENSAAVMGVLPMGTQLTPVPTVDDMGIVPAQAPTATKTFNPNLVAVGGLSTVTIKVTNPNPAAITLNGIGFTDSLPGAVVVALSPNATNTCGGTFNPVPNAASVTLGPSPPLAAGASCMVTFLVQDNTPAALPPSQPAYLQNCVTVTSSNGGSAPAACDSIATLPTFPAVGPGINKSFGLQSIELNHTSSMSFVVTNPDNMLVHDMQFIDTLPAGLQVASTAATSDTCAGMFNPALSVGATSVSYMGGSIPVGTASCAITLNVTGVSTTAAKSPACPALTIPTSGQQINCVTLSAFENGVNYSPAAFAILTVTPPPPPMPPALTKTFNPSTIELSANSALTFLVSNPDLDPPLILNNIAFTDTLPVGVIIATPSGLTGSCGGGVITAFAGTNSISLSGASLAGGGTCTFSVNVTGILAGAQVNTTSTITTTTPVTPPFGDPATATLNVNPPLDSYQINYLPDAQTGGVVAISNSGGLGADRFGPGGGTTGRICANIYTFAPDEEEVSCCSCLVTPNALVSLKAADLVGNPSTGVQPDSVVVKILFTVPGISNSVPGTQVGPFTASACNAATPFNLTNLAPGGRAWATKFHSPDNPPSASYSPTESEFIYNPITVGSLTQNTIADIVMMTTLCQLNVGNQSGAGICAGCSLGSIGAQKQ